MEKETFLIMKLILERLLNMDKWGGAHSELRRVEKSLPSHLKNTHRGRKQIEQASKALRNLDFIITLIKTHEIHVSLNPRKKKEIYEFIDKYDKDYSKDDI